MCPTEGETNIFTQFFICRVSIDTGNTFCVFSEIVYWNSGRSGWVQKIHAGVSGNEYPEPPSKTYFTSYLYKDFPARFVHMPVLCRPTSLQNPCIKRLKNLSDSFESSSDGPLRDGETFHRQCFSDPVQRPLKEELFQDKLSPEPGGEFTFGDKLGDDRRRYNSGGIFAIAGRAITPPLINAANQANFPINLLGIFSVSKLFIRLAAFFATLFVFRQVAVNLLGWKFGVKFSAIAFGSGLFAPIALLPP